MICFPNAKINLGLNVVSKRPDGYHKIESVFYPVDLCDALEIIDSEDGTTSFTQFGLKIDGNPEDNLVMRAYRLLAEDFPLPPLKIYLQKQIPFGAGLGGGSSDAAFMLKLLNEFASLGLSDTQMEDYAARIGADCAFFIRNRPALAEGIGNILTPIDLSLKKYRIEIEKPDVFVSTREAYSKIIPRRRGLPPAEVVKLPIAKWKKLLVNDFEDSIFALHPEIAKLKQSFYDRGALYASMSGSGSAVYGIFKK
ncbi:MAG: 4-(cytidine 5'-diphospho)-2-C-methyl-D-erythritol kinase [Dysgonamonadaceae bacterium]|jgi:4-diphosphocytidyl-2-C-methyl-D-erythritol kinase|nr:4-(cytidine 5'-diphospho)-2-C-methyl-D-erythritol kinase [Dysgonamonadaceae bacterium]